MNWTDEAVILSVRAHAEMAAVVELLTRHHGRHLGLVYGGRSRHQRPVLQPGNHVEASWKGRLAEHLGHVTVELRRGFAAEVLDDAAALSALSSLTTLAHVLPERDPHPALYEVSLFVLGFLEDESVWPALMVRWELGLLDELGFGLDLKTCAATGATDGLVYVSPKSGRAVSAAAGEPFKDRLLALPGFLAGRGAEAVSAADLAAGFALSGHFLMTRVLQPQNQDMPAARTRMVALVAKAGAGA